MYDVGVGANFVWLYCKGCGGALLDGSSCLMCATGGVSSLLGGGGGGAGI